MNTCKVDLFIHAVKYFPLHSWPREQLADLAYDRLLEKATSCETSLSEYHHSKESGQDSHRGSLLQWKLQNISFQDLGQMWPPSYYLWPLPCIWHSVVSVNIPTISSAFAIQECPYDPHPGEQKMVAPGIRPWSCSQCRRGRNQHQHKKAQKNTYYNNPNKTNPQTQQQNLSYKQSTLKTTHLDSEKFIVQKLIEIHWKDSPKKAQNRSWRYLEV